MRSKLLCVITALMAIVPLAANAVPIYSEIITPNTGIQSDIDSGPFIIANDFSPLIGGTISTVKWWGLYSPDGSPQASDDFTINFFSDSATGGPDTLLDSFNVGNSVSRTAAGSADSPNASIEFFSYEASIGVGLDVLLGLTYWVSIFNDTSSDTDDNWAWATDTRLTGSGPGNPSYFTQTSVDSSWTQTSDRPFYFELLGDATTVPEPTTLSLLGAGLLGFGLTRRRKQAA